MQKYDGIIFDLDGTLWDTVEAVTASWNDALRYVGLKNELTVEELSKYMGLVLEQILDNVLPNATESQKARLREQITAPQNQFRTHGTGKLYDGVEDTLKKLKEKYKIFLVSNCGIEYMNAFFDSHGLKKYFDDYECAERTGKTKGQNIRLIAERNNLKAPVYVGDTQFDYDATVEAEVPFIFAKYGFGEVENAEISVDSFGQLAEILN